jgi:hypothetical protein
MSCFLGTKDKMGICRASVHLGQCVVRTSRVQPRRFEVYDPISDTTTLCKVRGRILGLVCWRERARVCVCVEHNQGPFPPLAVHFGVLLYSRALIINHADLTSFWRRPQTSILETRG